MSFTISVDTMAITEADVGTYSLIVFLSDERSPSRTEYGTSLRIIYQGEESAEESTTPGAGNGDPGPAEDN